MNELYDPCRLDVLDIQPDDVPVINLDDDDFEYPSLPELASVAINRFHRQYEVASNGCHMWHGALSNERPIFDIGPIDGKRKRISALRFAWSLDFGELPPYKLEQPCSSMCVNAHHAREYRAFVAVPPAEYGLVVTFYRQGYTMESIAAAFECSCYSIHNVLVKCDEPRTNNRRVMTPDLIRVVKNSRRVEMVA